MSSHSLKTISVHEKTFRRFQRLGHLGDTYDSTLSKLIDIGEGRLLLTREEAQIPNSQR
jgi:hypothetical protein